LECHFTCAEILQRAEVFTERWSCTGWCSRCGEPRNDEDETQRSGDGGGPNWAARGPIGEEDG